MLVYQRVCRVCRLCRCFLWHEMACFMTPPWWRLENSQSVAIRTVIYHDISLMLLTGESQLVPAVRFGASRRKPTGLVGCPKWLALWWSANQSGEYPCRLWWPAARCAKERQPYFWAAYQGATWEGQLVILGGLGIHIQYTSNDLNGFLWMSVSNAHGRPH
jgi:hypothetical protein